MMKMKNLSNNIKKNNNLKQIIIMMNKIYLKKKIKFSQYKHKMILIQKKVKKTQKI